MPLQTDLTWNPTYLAVWLADVSIQWKTVVDVALPDWQGMNTDL